MITIPYIIEFSDSANIRILNGATFDLNSHGFRSMVVLDKTSGSTGSLIVEGIVVLTFKKKKNKNLICLQETYKSEPLLGWW